VNFLTFLVSAIGVVYLGILIYLYFWRDE